VKWQDEELHAELMAVFRKYFAENQQWINTGTYASSIRLRHLLSDIRNVCSARRKDIRLWQIEKRAELDERKTIRAQKGKGGSSKSGN
jgi:uncharacterized protein with von Willebrand factor type A (vWA) domain